MPGVMRECHACLGVVELTNRAAAVSHVSECAQMHPRVKMNGYSPEASSASDQSQACRLA